MKLKSHLYNINKLGMRFKHLCIYSNHFNELKKDCSFRDEVSRCFTPELFSNRPV